VLYVIFDICVF